MVTISKSTVARNIVSKRGRGFAPDWSFKCVLETYRGGEYHTYSFEKMFDGRVFCQELHSTSEQVVIELATVDNKSEFIEEVQKWLEVNG